MRAEVHYNPWPSLCFLASYSKRNRMFVPALFPMVVWLFLGSSHSTIHVMQASSARGDLPRTP